MEDYALIEKTINLLTDKGAGVVESYSTWVLSFSYILLFTSIILFIIGIVLMFKLRKNSENEEFEFTPEVSLTGSLLLTAAIMFATQLPNVISPEAAAYKSLISDIKGK